MASQQRIRVSHVGSLIRPPELVAFLERQRDGGKVDEAAFHSCVDSSVRDLVKQQAEAGVDIVSDGEFGKSISWSQYVMERLGGFETRPYAATGGQSAVYGKDRRDFAEFYAEYEAERGAVGMGKGFGSRGNWVVTGPITYTGLDKLQGDIARLKAAMAEVPGVEGFLPVVAPASVAPARKDEYYQRPDDGLFAIAEALRTEYKTIVDAGLIVQIDDAFLASMYDVMVPPGSLADYRKWAAVRIEALNHALKDIPAERARYHICWGSWNGPHSNDVAIRDIIDLVLQVNVGGYSLEMANPRHEHEWRVWETTKLPEGKVLLPGLVSHATNVVEHPHLVAERILRLARLVGGENVIASTDCGFAQGPFTRRVHPQIQWAKLRTLSEGAALASRELWPAAAAE